MISNYSSPNRVNPFYFLLLLIFILSYPILSMAFECRGYIRSDSLTESAKQSDTIRYSDHPFHIILWGGGSFYSAQILGKTPDSRMSMIGLQLNKRIYRFGNDKLSYTFDMDFMPRVNYPSYEDNGQRLTDYGLGIAPLGFQYNFDVNRPVHVFINSAGGFMFLHHAFPDKRGKTTNFTFELGGGVNFRLNPNYALIIGYKFHHFSNAERGEINPGMDSNLFFVALSLF